jgi:hypothetical protein
MVVEQGAHQELLAAAGIREVVELSAIHDREGLAGKRLDDTPQLRETIDRRSIARHGLSSARTERQPATSDADTAPTTTRPRP